MAEVKHKYGLDITGIKFGRLTAIREDGRKRSARFWICKCDCGKEIRTTRQHLIDGHTKSCGCLKHNNPNDPKITHGDSIGGANRLYRIWSLMKDRCLNKKSRAWKWYGGKGVSIFQDWLDYNNFKEWAISNGYNEKLTIDRIDSNGNYEPANCRWVTMHQQQLNKTSSRYVTYNGRSISILELSDITGIKSKLLYQRIITKGWDVEKAVSTPIYNCKDVYGRTVNIIKSAFGDSYELSNSELIKNICRVLPCMDRNAMLIAGKAFKMNIVSRRREGKHNYYKLNTSLC